MNGIEVTTGKRGESGRGMTHVMRPGVTSMGRKRAWCGGAIGGDVRHGVTRLPDDVHGKCVEAMEAAVKAGDETVASGGKPTDEYLETVTRAHVDELTSVVASGIAAKLKSEAVKTGVDPDDGDVIAAMYAGLAPLYPEASEGVAPLPATEVVEPISHPVASPDEKARAIDLERARLNRVRLERVKGEAKKREAEKESAPVRAKKANPKSSKSKLVAEFADIARGYRLNPDEFATKFKDGTLYVVPGSDTAYKRLRDRGRRITNKLQRAGFAYELRTDAMAGVVKLVKVKGDV